MLRRFTLAALLLQPGLVHAHHSLAAEFDSSKPVVLKGKVTNVMWMNPHVYIFMDAADTKGKVSNWSLESAAPNYLQRLGWYKNSLKPGDTVTIRAYQAKDRAFAAKTDEITMPDGRLLTTGHIDDKATLPAARR